MEKATQLLHVHTSRSVIYAIFFFGYAFTHYFIHSLSCIQTKQLV